MKGPDVTSYSNYYKRFAMQERGDDNIISFDRESDLKEAVGARYFEEAKAKGELLHSVYGVNQEGLSMCLADWETEEEAEAHVKTLLDTLRPNDVFTDADKITVLENAIENGVIIPSELPRLANYHTSFSRELDRAYGYGDLANEEFEDVVLAGYLSIPDRASCTERAIQDAATTEVTRIAEKHQFSSRSAAWIGR